MTYAEDVSLVGEKKVELPGVLGYPVLPGLQGRQETFHQIKNIHRAVRTHW